MKYKEMDVLLPINTSGDTVVRLYTSNKSNSLSTLFVLYYIVCAFFFSRFTTEGML